MVLIRALHSATPVAYGFQGGHQCIGTRLVATVDNA